jgi:hypothetical protein
MASSGNKGTTTNKSHSSIQNWHESFSLLDDGDGDEESQGKGLNLSRISRRENNRSFVDFLLDTPTSNNRNIHAMPASHALTRSNNNNSIESFSPIADQFLSPATLSHSFMERNFPE